jgi:hypothetical protein
MGDKQRQPFQFPFHALAKVDCRGPRVTSKGGLILVRELDEGLPHCRWRRGRQLQLAGSEDGGWLYTEQAPAVQNGNSA